MFRYDRSSRKYLLSGFAIKIKHCWKIQLTSQQNGDIVEQQQRRTRSNWADKRQADLYCTKRNEPFCTPLMSDCPIIHTVDREFRRPGNWFSGAHYDWSAALIQ